MIRVLVCGAVFAAMAFAQTPAIPGPGSQGRGGTGVKIATPAGRGAPAPKPPAAAAAAPAPTPRDLKYPPLNSIRLQKPVIATLPNGMRLYLVEDHEMPVLGGVLLVRAGSAFDPPERIGINALAGQLLRSGGTVLKTGEQVEDAARSLGMTIDSEGGPLSTTLTFSALKENTEASLALVRELLTEPEYRQNRLEQAKAQFRKQIAQRNDDLNAVTRRELAALIYGKDSPYGWQPEYFTIDRITRIDLKNYHKRYFFPANTMLGLWGDFDAAGMRALLERLFAEWTVKQEPAPDFPKVRDTPAPGVYLVERKDASQTYFSVGHLGGIANQKDLPALEVMGLLFNQLQSRITQRARAPLGNSNVALMGVEVEDVNGVWGSEPGYQGVFRVSGATRGVSTVGALKALYDDIGQMRTVEVSDEQLRIAKESAAAAISASVDTHGKAFLRMMQQEYHHYPQDFAQQYQTAVAAVTKADVLRVARQYLDPARLTTVVAGNPQMFSQPLESLNAPVNRIDITIPESGAQIIETTEESMAAGKRLLAKAQAAAGGLERLSAVTDYTVTADYLIDPNVQGLGGSKIAQVDRWIAPGAFRQDLSLPTGHIAAYTDGKAGWVLTPQGSGPLVGSQFKQVQGDLFRVYIRLLISDHIDGRIVNQVDQDLVEISDTTGQTVRLEFDSATGLPRRITYNVPQAAGTPLFGEDVYSDFREVAGIRVPFSVSITQGGRKFAQVVVTDCKINSGLKPADLARKQ